MHPPAYGRTLSCPPPGAGNPDMSIVISGAILRIYPRRTGKSMRTFTRLLAPFLLGFVFFAGAVLANAASVTVFAAASLKEAMDEQARQFETGTGNKALTSYAGSNALAKQIEAGAPADIFVSADLDWMDYAAQRNLLRAGTRFNLLRNLLVLIAPASSTTTLKIAPGFSLAAALGNGKLAMANPDSVPAGKYGKSALEKLGVWASVQDKVARGENVRSALAFVSRGEALFGIVYNTDALADKGVKVVDTFPQDSYPPIIYPAALIATSRSPAAQAFLDYLRTPAAAQIWAKYGFGLVK
jgi:molybdate transport system substrate-binding protein